MKLLTQDNYLVMIKSSIGVKLWQTLYAEIDGKRVNITKNGKLSCAYFVSSLLHHFKLIDDVHATVEGTLKDLQNSGWKKTAYPKPGAIVVWEPSDDHDGTPHPHIGFFVGGGKAISNSSKLKYPTMHDIYFGRLQRKIRGFWMKKV